MVSKAENDQLAVFLLKTERLGALWFLLTNFYSNENKSAAQRLNNCPQLFFDQDFLLLISSKTPPLLGGQSVVGAIQCEDGISRYRTRLLKSSFYPSWLNRYNRHRERFWMKRLRRVSSIFFRSLLIKDMMLYHQSILSSPQTCFVTYLPLRKICPLWGSQRRKDRTLFQSIPAFPHSIKRFECLRGVSKDNDLTISVYLPRTVQVFW